MRGGGEFNENVWFLHLSSPFGDLHTEVHAFLPRITHVHAEGEELKLQKKNRDKSRICLISASRCKSIRLDWHKIAYPVSLLPKQNEIVEGKIITMPKSVKKIQKGLFNPRDL